MIQSTERIVRETLAIVDRDTPLAVGEPLVQRVLRHFGETDETRRAQQCSACHHVTCSRCGYVVPPNAQDQFRSHVCAVPA